jgi:hypothetical protein
MMSSAQVPPAMLLGDSVLFTPVGVKDLHALLELAVRTGRRDGIPVSQRLQDYRAAVDAAMSHRRASDVVPEAVSSEWVSTEAIRREFGVGVRQAQRIAAGIPTHRKDRGDWWVTRSALDAEKQRRDTRKGNTT